MSGKKLPRPPELWSLEWKQADDPQQRATVARLYAQQDCQVAIQGRGVLRRLCSSDDDNDHVRVVTVNGFRLLVPKHDERDGHRFDCPSWSSWATLSLSAGAVVEIASSYNPINPNSSSNSSSLDGNAISCSKPSFQVWSAHDPQARPTVVPPSWKQAMDAIEHDFWQQQQRKQQQQRQQHHLLIHRDNLEDEEVHASSVSPETLPSCFQVLFCGAKNVGKSTCLRYCLNRLLSSSLPTMTASTNKNDDDDDEDDEDNSNNNTATDKTIIEAVAVLDADVGQSELGPPGMLTLSLCRQPLLQQPHCHFLYDHSGNSTNSRQQQQQQHHSDYLDAYFFGATSSQVDPARYIDGVHKLLQTFLQYCSCHGSDTTKMTTTTTKTSIPLLVNLDGWVKGLGLQVLQAIVTQHQPTHVVQILGDLKSRQFDLSLPTSAIATLTTTATTAGADGDEVAAAVNDDNDDDDHDKNHIAATTKIHVCYAYHSKQKKTTPTVSRASSMAAGNNSDNNKTPVMSRSSSFAAGDNDDHDFDDEGNENDDDDERNGNSTTETTSPQQQEQTPSQQQQQHPAVVAAHSMSLPSASLRTLRLLAYFLERHDEQDNSLLEIWDRIGLGQAQQEGFLDADVTCEMAHRLAAARPYVVPMETVEVVFSNTELHNDICSEQGIWDALNGSIVGLLCKEPEQNGVTMSVEQLAMLSCVGLGIVRAIDRVRRIFYILTPVPHDKLVSVNVLSLANHSLTLPFESLYRGVHSEASPYMAYDNDRAKTSNVLGAEPMKSRNSIARKSLVGCNG